MLLAKISTLFCLLISTIAFGEYDLKYGAIARSRTLSLLAYTEAGYAQKIWGDNRSDTDANASPYFFYGYIRLASRLQTSLSVNSATPRLSFVPIAPLEFFLGEEFYHSMMNSGTYRNACRDGLECKGYTRRPFYGASLKLGYGPWSAYIEGQKGYVRHQKGDIRYLHYSTDLILQGPQTLHSMVAFLAYKIDDTWSMGALYWNDTVSRVGDSSKFAGVVAAFAKESWTFTTGTGMYTVSSLALSDEGASNGLSVFLEAKKTISKGLVL